MLLCPHCPAASPQPLISALASNFCEAGGGRIWVSSLGSGMGSASTWTQVGVPEHGTEGRSWVRMPPGSLCSSLSRVYISASVTMGRMHCGTPRAPDLPEGSGLPIQGWQTVQTVEALEHWGPQPSTQKSPGPQGRKHQDRRKWTQVLRVLWNLLSVKFT